MNNKLNVNMHLSDISACHTIKSGIKSRKPENDNIIVRLVNRKKKIQILKKAKLLKGTKIFINEHFKAKNNELAYIPSGSEMVRYLLEQWGHLKLQ